MLKIQPTQLLIKHSPKAMFVADNNSAKVHKSHTGDEHSGFKMHSYNYNDMNEISFHSHDMIKKDNRIVFNKKTAKNINFSGLPFPEGSKLSKRAWKWANNSKFNFFSDMAERNQTLFEALFAVLITCGMRPAAIGLQINEKNKEKNKKAISHSISSGIIGYGFAYAVFNPIKKGLDKVIKNPDKFAKGFDKFLTYNGKKLINLSDRTSTYKSVFNYGSQIFTASVRSGITIAMIPLIDKYLLNKIFNSKIKPSSVEELKNDPTYKFAFINFKNSQHASKVFQNFSGVMK